MQLTNTYHLKDKTLETLSSGQRQCAWIAMCLAQEPPVILFDEPVIYLDSAHQIDFFKLINRLKTEKLAVTILVLHDLNQAAKYGNYLIAVKNGKIFAEDSAQKVLTKDTLKAVYNIDSKIIKTEGELIIIPK